MDKEKTEKIIFHIDVNSAFLSWSAVKRLSENPKGQDLRLIPSAVGGDVRTRHGIITAKSIPAKKYGIKTGEPVVKALQKCPQLLVIPSDFQSYKVFSNKFIDILHSYTPLVEKASIDEAYVDVTEFCSGESAFKTRQNALSLADEIRNRIYNELKFTVNVGVSSNKLLAKTASDFTKPDRTHELWAEQIPEKFWTLPIQKLYGCGKKTAEKLIKIGIKTVGDAAHSDIKTLKSTLGNKAGEYIYSASNGIGSATVKPERAAAKSYSNELTTGRDITRTNFNTLAPELLIRLSEKVSSRLKRDGIAGDTVTVSVKTSDFKRFSRQTKLPAATDDGKEIYTCALTLLKQLMFGNKNENGLYDEKDGIRLLGVGVSSLTDSRFEQTNIEAFENAVKQTEQSKKIDEVLNTIRTKYGTDAIKRGNNM